MLILMGRTCSGKDKIVNELISKHNFKKLTTYTSRPKRMGEKDDVDYHFITEEDFKQKIQTGFFAEWKTYNTEYGVWYYGTALEDLKAANDKSVIILTPDGYRDVIGKLSKRPISIYIYANNLTIEKRLLERGDDKEEANRRLHHDNIDFRGLENEVNRIVYNNDGNDIDDAVKKILQFTEVE